MLEVPVAVGLVAALIFALVARTMTSAIIKQLKPQLGERGRALTFYANTLVFWPLIASPLIITIAPEEMSSQVGILVAFIGMTALTVGVLFPKAVMWHGIEKIDSKSTGQLFIYMGIPITTTLVGVLSVSLVTSFDTVLLLTYPIAAVVAPIIIAMTWGDSEIVVSENEISFLKVLTRLQMLNIPLVIWIMLLLVLTPGSFDYLDI